MQFMRRNKKQVISKGDLCTVQITGTQGLPQIVMENNEVMFVGEFNQNNDKIAICSSVYVNELLFIHKDLLTKKTKQPSASERFFIMQMDTLTTLKEISFQLKNLIQNNVESEEDIIVNKPINEDTNYN